MFTSLDKSVRVATALSQDGLQSLANNELDVIRVKRFCEKDLCGEISRRMLGSRLYGRYENAPLIGRVGQALYESQASTEANRRYWTSARQWIQELRLACSPWLTPIDKLRLELDEIWSTGAAQGSLDGRKMFVGLARVFEENSTAEPHQDVLEWDVPESPTARRLHGQLAANIYLQMPPSGGQLAIWPVELSREQYNAMQLPGTYGVDAELLQCPPVRLRPEEGELILFNSRRVHAVEAPIGGPRITWSCFIGIPEDGKSLMMWS
jgi:hypothetical protein